MEISTTEENYLRLIFVHEVERKQPITTKLMSELTHTKPASVTEMLKRMGKKGLLNYKPYKGVSLTEEGKKHAVKLIRKNRLWETYLVNFWDFDWDEIEEIADELEHLNSEKLIKKIDELLNYPKSDPHGEPIPNSQGVFFEVTDEKLTGLRPGDRAQITGIKRKDSEFLHSLKQLKLNPGVKIKLLDKDLYDNTLRVEIQGEVVKIPPDIAQNVLVNKYKSFIKLF